MCLVCWRRDRLPSPVVLSLVAQLVKNPPAMWETWVQSLGWKIPGRRERPPTSIFWPGEFHGWYSAWGRRVGHDWVTFTSLLILCVLSVSVQLFVTPWTVARQARLSMGILQARTLERRTVWRFLKKLEIELLYDPAIPLLGIHTEETRRERDTCT